MDYMRYNNFNNDAMGVYTPQTQLDFDINRLKFLGFTDQEIETLQFIVYNYGKVTQNTLSQFGLSYESSRRLKYMYDIVTGKVQIESPDDLAKHMKKLFGNIRRIGIQDLAVSKLSKVPRMAVVAGIQDETFSVYNSKNYSLKDRLYKVIDVSSTRITVETDRKPTLKYKQPKFVEGVVEIKEIRNDGKLDVAFDKKYCKLVNRFIIVASLRRPEFHHGLIEIICIEGTKVYVYAQNLGTREKVSYNMGTQRVYDYGYFPNEIQPKLKAVAAELYKHLCGVYATIIPANQDFNVIPIEEEKEDEDEIVIEE